jgi:hypothetical protein
MKTENKRSKITEIIPFEPRFDGKSTMATVKLDCGCVATVYVNLCHPKPALGGQFRCLAH